MIKRVKLAITILLAIAACTLLWQVVRHREPGDPVYQGKPLSRWLRSYEFSYVMQTQHGFEAQQREEQSADAAVRHAGTNAIPTLLRMLRANDSTLKRRLIRLVNRQNLFRIEFTPAREQNDAALRAFKILGAEGRTAVPVLMEIANQNVSPSSQCCSISALGAIGPAASEAIPSLLCWATNANPDVRVASIGALGRIHSDHEQVLPVLMRALQDPDARPVAVWALGKFGADAKPAVPALITLLNSPSDKTDKSTYTNALRDIDQGAAARLGIQ